MLTNNHYGVKIATNYEMGYKLEMISRRIAAGENVATWCVQDSEYTYDIYNGTFKQCLKEAKRRIRDGEEVVCIALITLTEDICGDFCVKQYDVLPSYNKVFDQLVARMNHDIWEELHRGSTPFSNEELLAAYLEYDPAFVEVLSQFKPDGLVLVDY